MKWIYMKVRVTSVVLRQFGEYLVFQFTNDILQLFILVYIWENGQHVYGVQRFMGEIYNSCLKLIEDVIMVLGASGLKQYRLHYSLQEMKNFLTILIT